MGQPDLAGPTPTETSSVSSPRSVLEQLSPTLVDGPDLADQIRSYAASFARTAQFDALANFPSGAIVDAIKRDGSPIPIDEFRETYMPGDAVAYWLFGFADYLLLSNLWRRHQQTLGKCITVLDLGCASGRVLRHFVNQSNTPRRVHGADINSKHIRWIEENIPTALPFQTTRQPNLVLESRSVDLLYGLSVFTHIDDFESAWRHEIFRVMRPGGIVVLTFHTERGWTELDPDLMGYLLEKEHHCVELDIAKVTPEMFEHPMPPQRFAFRETALGDQDQPHVFHPLEVLQQQWGNMFEVLEVVECAHGRHQDALVLRRPLDV
jgi:SAM-dependent methyltransferase